MTPEQIRMRLEELYEEQSADEWPLAKQKKIRDEIDRLEQLLREATWPSLNRVSSGRIGGHQE